MIRHLVLAVVIILSAGQTAMADPPARVGRLSYIGGTVSTHAPDQDQWSQAELNYPVTTGSGFWTEPHARAEIEVGGAELRMDQNTELDITQLDDAGTVINLPQGVINVHLNSLPVGGVQIETATAEIKLTKPGTYHIDGGQPNGDQPPAVTQVMVLEGEAQVNAENSNTLVMPGENAVIGSNPPSLSLAEGRAVPFDDWALSREKREVAQQSTQYISPEVTGYEDLDSQGSWSNSPDYGAVWYPATVAPDWAPYRYGHWANIAPWGWTWIDNAPWGFAPFHYGRWVHEHDRWGWCPGERVARPVYAPALVAFVGGNNFNVTIANRSSPAVGWVPLAPREIYRPYYRTSPEYVRNVNITNVNKTIINNITVNNITAVNHYANAEHVTVVSQDNFAHGMPVHKALVKVPRDRVEKISAAPEIPHIAPTHEAKDKPAPAPAHHFNMPERRHEQQEKPPVENKIITQPTQPQIIRPVIPAKPEVKTEIPQTPRIIRGTEQEHQVIKPETNRHLERLGGETQAIAHPAVTPPARPEVARPQIIQEVRRPIENPHEFKHPEQHGQIAPSPQGWQRMPPQNQPHKEEPHQNNAQPENKKKDDK